MNLNLISNYFSNRQRKHYDLCRRGHPSLYCKCIQMKRCSIRVDNQAMGCIGRIFRHKSLNCSGTRRAFYNIHAWDRNLLSKHRVNHPANELFAFQNTFSTYWHVAEIALPTRQALDVAVIVACVMRLFILTSRHLARLLLPFGHIASCFRQLYHTKDQ